jgi:zinc D-Ala-D-Ala carboxypeptidase
VGDLSPHFSRREFACHHCGQVEVSGELVSALERLRSSVGQPIYIVSGYRCAIHNAAVGGAPRSQHLYGKAADLSRGVATIRQALEAGFTGVGHRGSWAVHVDVRPGAPVTFLD